jgi:hypothetical protein
MPPCVVPAKRDPSIALDQVTNLNFVEDSWIDDTSAVFPNSSQGHFCNIDFSPLRCVASIDG